MFYILSKTLKCLIFPLTWVLALLGVAAFVKDKKHKKRRLLFFSLACFIFLVFSCKPLLDWTRYRATRAYAEHAQPDRYYPMAVVMGGFGSMDPQTGQMNTTLNRGGRLYEAVRLQRMGIVGKILVTGDATVYLDDEGHTHAAEFQQYLIQFGVPPASILCEQKARNTRENATLSIALLDSLGYVDQDCLLITSATHMRRAQGAFAAEGWEMDPYAVNIYPKPGHLQAKNFLPSYQALVDWQELLNEWVGNVAYRIVGYKK